MLQKLIDSRTKAREEDGFTLIELLVVIIILGILAAVVVFAVSGINDKGQTSACKIDTRTIRTAEEAFFAAPIGGKKTTAPGQYADEQPLVDQGFLSELSSYHNVARVAAVPANPGPAVAESFTITEQDPNCGSIAASPANNVDSAHPNNF